MVNKLTTIITNKLGNVRGSLLARSVPTVAMEAQQRNTTVNNIQRTYIGLPLNALEICPTLMKSGFHGQILTELSSIKFHANPSSRGRAVTCGQTDGQT